MVDLQQCIIRSISLNMQISIIIPAYNEENKIAQDVIAASEFIDSHFNSGEIIVVDDGSSDNTSMAATETAGRVSVTVRIIRQPHTGKGAAVRNGMTESTGDYVMFADSGLCIPYNDAIQGIELVKSGEYGIAHGSRYHQLSEIVIKKGLLRRLASTLFRKLIPFIAGVKGRYTDTQCGFKIYSGTLARSIYGRCSDIGYMFDIEVILRAEAMGVKIGEFPVHWSSDSDSRLSLSKTVWVVLGLFFNPSRYKP